MGGQRWRPTEAHRRDNGVLQAQLPAVVTAPTNRRDLQATTELKPALSLAAVLDITKGSRGFDAAARAAFIAGITAGLPGASPARAGVARCESRGLRTHAPGPAQAPKSRFR